MQNPVLFAACGDNTPKYIDAVNFIPLPDLLRALKEKQIPKVK